MAWRIADAVVRGEIDNTVEGRTTGRIWLLGRDGPLELSLEGDCWRDLAGSRLEFENPEPKQGRDDTSLDTRQNGVVGDITASRKNKVPLVGEEEFGRLYRDRKEIPFEWRNTLYLEWFSERNGRVVIESASYRLKVSDHVWEMDEDAEEAQKLANLNAMRDFMAQVIRRREPSGIDDDDTPEELDEFAWEERLKESDRLTDAYQEVLEKYMEDEDCERKEAFVMGWDGLLDALAERDEAGAGGISEENYEIEAPDFGGDDEEDFGDAEGGGGIPFDEDDSHPLQIRAQELALRAMDIIGQDEGPGTPSYRLITSLLQVSGKLAGALNGRGSGYEPETGFVLAVLKRCLNWLNEAVGACQEIMEKETDADARAAYEHVRSTAFQIRDGIVELRRELKQS